MTAATTSQLWNAWRTRRDARAFEALVAPLTGYALALARRAGCDAAEAEDVLQESLVRLACERTEKPVELGLRVWLFRSVRALARSHVRSRSRRRGRERKVARREAVAPSPASDAHEQVEAALGHLADAERELVLLRYFHDCEYREISAVLGVSENACRIRVHRALAKLRERLGGNSAALLAALPLPVLSNESLFVQKAATASLASASGAATAASSTGVVAVTAAKKTAVAAGIVAAAGAATWMGAVALDSAEDDPSPSVAAAGADPDRAAVEPASRNRSASDAVGDRDLVSELDVRPDEVEFLRSALRAERARREGARIRPEDGGIEVVDRVIDWGADPGAELWDANAFAARVRTGGGTAVQISADGENDVTQVDLREYAGQSVLEFGPGVFELSQSPWTAWNEEQVLPELEIRGAGMDATRLVGPHTLVGGRMRLENVRFRDLTWDGRDRFGPMVSVSGRGAVVLENVRVEGWSSGGFSSGIAVGGRLYFGARNCEFVAHENESGGVGFNMRGKAVALFDGCRFLDMGMAVRGATGQATGAIVHLRECVFENTRLTDSAPILDGRQPFTARVRGGTVRFGKEATAEQKRRDDWRGPMDVEIGDVSFAPGVERCSVATVLRLLDRVRSEEGWRVARVRYRPSHPAGPRVFDVYEVGPKTWDRRGRRFLLDDGVAREVKLPRDERPSLPHGDQLTGALSLAATLRAGVPADARVRQVTYGSGIEDEQSVPSVEIRSGYGHTDWTLSARTGRVLRKQ